MIFKKLIRPLSFAIVVALSGCGDGTIQVDADESLPEVIEDSLPALLDIIVDQHIAENGPGMALLVRQKGELLYRHSRGKANIHVNIDIAGHTGFRLTSLSITFIAIALMQLHEAGKLNLTDKLGEYLPELNGAYQAISLEQLLTHQSGIPDLMNDKNDEGLLVFDGMTNAEFMSFYARVDALEFVPGTADQYSNTGYLLLSEVIERASGLSFDDYMLRNIFAPLGMDDSYIIHGQFPRSTEDALNFAHLTQILGFNSQTHGFSGQISSLDDLLLFIQALKFEQLISARTSEEMMQAKVFLTDLNYRYGYGWLVDPGYSDIVFHSGCFDGYQSRVYLDKAHDLQIIVLANGGNSSQELYWDIIHLVTGVLVNK
ncbi:serine hydrolase [Aliiglaciecola sp. CAU 1673]|uniref:serine hydrolase domain-containing protein n=1 Tax=Aliiglaciecola sp. CAU 1673 TaxID=3032595 RepID=UPI0023D97F37|nr:serine hydrolase domain-containing protein [Aliiglaciecola sp. CAU 1673]MDF2178634.1 serine hydrolase [Aliiglaciecola sp. CAU 1673]